MDNLSRVEETHKILESSQPVRRPRFCTNSPSYKYQGVQTTRVKILSCLFRALWRIKQLSQQQQQNTMLKFIYTIFYIATTCFCVIISPRAVS